MPDPLSIGAALVKAVATDDPGGETETTSLLKRLLLPSVDEFAEALRRSVAYRTRNFGRIVDKAEKKARDERSGVVSQRVAYVLLEEGSLCDDELMAEYLGGLLAGSRTPDGRDDRAISWCQIIKGMSWLQVRAHFIIYRELAARLQGLTNLKLGMADTHRLCQVDFEQTEFLSILTDNSGIESDGALQDAILGLAWLDLIDDSSYAIGSRSSHIILRDSPFEEVVRVVPTVRGLELYGWAQGLPGLSVGEFTSKAIVFDTEPSVSRPAKMSFGTLDQLTSHP
jgi:hypothetical protein